MAVIDKLPDPGTIKAHRGLLDYYVHRGQVIVRSWPNKPVLPRSPAVQTAGAAFASFSRRASSTDPTVRSEALLAATGQPWTWKDIVTSAAYGNLITWS